MREYACHFGVDCSEQAVIRFEWSLAHHGSWTRGGPSVTSRSIYIKMTLKLNQTTSLAQRPAGRAFPVQSGVTAENCEAAHASTATRSWSVGWGQQHSRRYSFVVDQGLVDVTQGGSRSAFYSDGDQQTRPRKTICDLGSITTSDLNWG